MGEARRKKQAGYVPSPREKKKRLTNREINRIADDMAKELIYPWSPGMFPMMAQVAQLNRSKLKKGVKG